MEIDGAVTPTLAVLTVSLLVGLWHWLQKRPHPNFPPGPKGWPIIGNIAEFSGVGPHHLFMSMAEKYGNVFSVRIGTHWSVILNGSKTIKEALIKFPVEFAGRPKVYSLDILSDWGKDIALSQYTPTWKLHRKLASSAFRTFATGNNEKFESLVFSMTDKVSKIFEEKGSEPLELKNIISLAIYNFLAQMVFGKQYELDDPDLMEWMSLSEDSIEVFGNGLIADFLPFMKVFPTPGVRAVKKLVARFHKLALRELAEHEENYDPSAGTGSSVQTILWAVACLVDHPDVQEKVQKEIDEVIGPNRRPKMDDRGTLPYTESTLCEVFRYSSTTPINLPHATTCDVNFGGYFIPKGTWVLTNLYSMHFDKAFWGDPENFRPEHFLNESGTVRQHPEGFLPFSAGRRVCLGESVARAELFLMFTWLFQNFTFKKPLGKETEVYTTVDKTAIAPILKDCNVIVTKRS